MNRLGKGCFSAGQPMQTQHRAAGQNQYPITGVFVQTAATVSPEITTIVRIHSLSLSPLLSSRHPQTVYFHSQHSYFSVMGDWTPLAFSYRPRPPLYPVSNLAPSTLSLGMRLAVCHAAASPALSLPRVGARPFIDH